MFLAVSKVKFAKVNIDGELSTPPKKDALVQKSRLRKLGANIHTVEGL